ncbi:predicted protein [Phaeodactylum tricornutum CCAP 1055/1]|jgi:hypothetical protein|uniref:Uncharacterized protein n=2 Tax=Phaeodactylum tricornutum TaxID=2850 RepID=B7FVL8_PHATC|nr:predicted protein [Phaeodactylum tricornutum CCAP 1055/1]EEC49425.1 predicted protein [Phaeodactylum tricornutum CCAP 1055/1]|eukprot:XP_002178727.1 predicted protein [Phaeodactylum tricornutum CCAP 1055/1]
MLSIPKLKATLAKALAFNSKPTEETFPEFPKVLIWFRFLLGLSYGLYLGLNDYRSGTLPLQALNLITFLPVMYAKLYLGMDGDHFQTQTVFAGTFQAMSLCLLIWIYLFTAAHEADESKLASLLVATVAPMMGDGSDGAISDATYVPPVQKMPESEF